MLILVIPLYMILQAVVLWQVRGTWRAAAALPMLFMLPLFVLAVYEYTHGSDLWPLMLILSSPIAIVALAALWGLYRWTTRRTGQPSA